METIETIDNISYIDHILQSTLSQFRVGFGLSRTNSVLILSVLYKSKSSDFYDKWLHFIVKS